MKGFGVLVVMIGTLTACNNSSTLENTADSLGKKVDSFGNKVWDSVKQDSRELKEKIENQLEKKDTADK